MDDHCRRELESKSMIEKDGYMILQIPPRVNLRDLICKYSRNLGLQFSSKAYAAAVWTLIQTGFAANPRVSPHPIAPNVFFARSEFSSTVVPAVHRPSPS